MSSSFEIPEVDAFTAGAVGPPGQRVFYLQFRSGERIVSLKVEKTQVAALCRVIDALLADLPAVDAAVAPVEGELALAEPVLHEWVVGGMGVTYDEEDDRVVLVADELVEEGEDGARARIGTTRAQMAAFARHGADLVAAGRPPCPLCGGPLDPDGHVCVKLNGHRDIAP